MDKTTFDFLKNSAPLLKELISIPEELRDMARSSVSEPISQNRLSEVAQLMIESYPAFLHPSVHRAYNILRMIESETLSDEEMASRLNCSKATIQQTLNALKQGGISIQEISISSKGYHAPANRSKNKSVLVEQ
jgi:biotin operon repressor